MGKYDVIIVGAGLSGLAVSHFLSKSRPDLRSVLLEKSDRPGGAIKSHKTNGFLAEWGPHGFLDNIEESRELLADLRVDDQIQKAPLKKFLRYMCRDGRLMVIPQSPPAIIKSNLLSFGSKLRVLGDLVRKPLAGEQTISRWAAYRFGNAILPFADIVQTGTFAGNMEKLSIDAAMPGLRKLEMEYGSVFKGAIKSRKNKAGAGMPAMVSFKRGMEQMIISLAAGRDIRLNTAVQKISRDGKTWQVSTASEAHTADHLVIALHINRALPLLSSLMTAPGQSVPESMVYNIVLGFEKGVKIPYGFGYLAPGVEARFALGALFPTHMFPGRAPEGMQSLEVLVGGMRNPHHLSLPDDDLVEKAYTDISRLMDLPAKPLFADVIRPEIGIPQLELGHHRFQSYREEMETKFPGLYINGFGWEGIGVNEMIKQAKQTASNLIKGSGGEKGPVTVKGVYF